MKKGQVSSAFEADSVDVLNLLDEVGFCWFTDHLPGSDNTRRVWKYSSLEGTVISTEGLFSYGVCSHHSHLPWLLESQPQTSPCARSRWKDKNRLCFLAREKSSVQATGVGLVPEPHVLIWED